MKDYHWYMLACYVHAFAGAVCGYLHLLPFVWFCGTACTLCAWLASVCVDRATEEAKMERLLCGRGL